jgi:hypothetical protein
MELLKIVFIREKSILRSYLNFEALFSLKLATNPIDFFYVLWLALKWWIRGLFIGIRRVLEALEILGKSEVSFQVQVGEEKPNPRWKWIAAASVNTSVLELTLPWVAWMCALDTLRSSSTCRGLELSMSWQIFRILLWSWKGDGFAYIFP